MKTNLSRFHLLTWSLSCSICLGLGGFMASASLAETALSGGVPNSRTTSPSTLALPSLTPTNSVSQAPASTTSDTNESFANEIPEVPGSDVLVEEGPTAADPSLDTPRQSSGFSIGKILTTIPIQDILQKNPQVVNYFKKNPEIIKIFVDNPQILEFLIKTVGPKGF